MNRRIGFSMVIVLLSILASLSFSNTVIFSMAQAVDHSSSIAAKPMMWWIAQSNPDLARRGMQAVFDSHRQVVVMFGGFDSQDNPDNETWEFDGTSWQQVTPIHSPLARSWCGMAYDDNRHVVVLFGGKDGQGSLSDTWEYNGADWVQVQTVHAPTPRHGFGMTYDSCRQKVVLFGGGELLTGTWEYDGVDWHDMTVSTSPGGVFLTAMAFDVTRCRVVLFGGDGSGAQGVNDTWEYDGVDWALTNTSTSPMPRWGHALAFDPVNEKVVLFGGYGPEYPSGTPLADTWEYDGINWVETRSSVSPSAREQHVLVYEGNNQKILLFGGFGSGETWLYGNVDLVYLPLVFR